MQKLMYTYLIIKFEVNNIPFVLNEQRIYQNNYDIGNV